MNTPFSVNHCVNRLVNDIRYNRVASSEDLDQRIAEVFERTGKSSIQEIVDDDFNTPLHVVPNARMAKLLIDRGFSLSGQNRTGHTPLYIAALDARLEVMQVLVEHGANVNQRMGRGQTAIFAHRDESIRWLLEQGADVNVQDATGATPLFEFCRMSGISAVKMMLKHGADPSICNNEGISPLGIAAKLCPDLFFKEFYADLMAVEDLSSWPSLPTAANPMVQAIKGSSKAAVSNFLDAGYGIHAQDVEGLTPIARLTARMFIDEKLLTKHDFAVFRTLLERGADLDDPIPIHAHPDSSDAPDRAMTVAEVIMQTQDHSLQYNSPEDRVAMEEVWQMLQARAARKTISDLIVRKHQP